MSQIDPYFCIYDGELGYPENYQKIPLRIDFKVYLLCNTQDKRYIFIHTDRQEFNLSSKDDDKNVYRLFLNFIKRLNICDLANDLFQHYDSTELHQACIAKYEGNEYPIYRIRKANLRLYFVFVGSDIVLFRLSTKRQDKINSSEQKILNNRVKSILTYPTDSSEFLKRVL